jgi:hypothetical protein
MRKKNSKLFRALGWFSFTQIVTCSNTSDIKTPWPESNAEDDASVPLRYEKLANSHRDLSGQLQNGENLIFKKKRYLNLNFRKKRWISHVVRRCQSTSGVPNSRVRPKLRRAKSDINAASHDGQRQNNILGMPKFDVELRIERKRAVVAVADACEQFRNFVI